jgi:hypothetical protein
LWKDVDNVTGKDTRINEEITKVIDDKLGRIRQVRKEMRERDNEYEFF